MSLSTLVFHSLFFPLCVLTPQAIRANDLFKSLDPQQISGAALKNFETNQSRVSTYIAIYTHAQKLGRAAAILFHYFCIHEGKEETNRDSVLFCSTSLIASPSHSQTPYFHTPPLSHLFSSRPCLPSPPTPPRLPHTPTAIVHDMSRTEIAAGTAVIKQGDVADYFYVVERGQFQVCGIFFSDVSEKQTHAVNIS